VTASLSTLDYENVGALREGVFRLLKCLHLADKQRTDAPYLVRVWQDIAEGQHDSRRASAGPQASLFRPGDEVFYAGSIIRSGTNAEFHLVDERIVGHEPRSLGFAEAAALPLTSITAWEALFDRTLLGPDRFLLSYANGLECFGYRQSPLEAMAYDAETTFANSTAVFNVETMVAEKLGL
jgi:hypothetical protein